jgi:hypothetical protein
MPTLNARSDGTFHNASAAAEASSKLPTLPGVATSAMPRFTITSIVTVALSGRSRPNARSMHQRIAARAVHDTSDAPIADARRPR